MVSTAFLQTILLVATASLTAARPLAEGQEHIEVLKTRASTTVNPAAVTGTTCIDTTKTIIAHDNNVAQLQICGGIAGTIEKCGGSPQSTIGASGTAKFTLTTTVSGATINVSKGRWEGCVRAAQAVCPTGSYSSTCIGGASTGNVAFTLDNP